MPSTFKQDDGQREYRCDGFACEYDGDTYCQNCGYEKGESPERFADGPVFGEVIA